MADIITINSSGIQTATRDEILQYLISQFKGIYGDNVYITEGTEDYNMLLALADMLNDMGMVAVSVGNGFNLATATGFQLDNIANIFYNKVNRNPATNSTVQVVVTGTPNTNIVNGQVKDELGGIWNLQTPFTIPSTGSITVIATYSETGPYLIQANQINGFNSIVTPVAGWTSVNNPSASSVGQDIESDAQFRYRLATISQGNAKSVANTVLSNLLGLSTIYNAQLWENDTNVNKSFSDVSLSNVLPHSIVVSLYGDFGTGLDLTDNDIAQTIYDYKGTGVGTFAPTGGTGTKNITITNNLGQDQQINFVKAVANEIVVNIKLSKLSLNSPNLSTDTTTAIQNAITSYMQDQNIGSLIYASSLYSVVASALASSVGAGVYNITSIYFNDTQAKTQIQNTYYQKPITQDSDIKVVLS